MATGGILSRIPWTALVAAGLLLTACRCQEERPKAITGKGGLVWLSIPGGTFSMGSTEGETDERPVHQVAVNVFLMSRSEVTVGQYLACVRAGACRAPDPGDGCMSDNRAYCTWSQGTEDHPVNCVTWKQARAFCRWAGGRLPSEAEWEYAARSGLSSRRFPWGNHEATCRLAVMNEGGAGCGQQSTDSVCSRPAGNTAHGLCDMAGNVWEWVEDCWRDSYRGAPVDGSPAVKGCHPDYGRVLRGGSWGSFSTGMRASVRSPNAQARRINCGHNGFRCASKK